MVLPLNLAMTSSEIASASVLPKRISWMSCRFCVYTEGITNIPEALPEGSMLILTDRESCTGHSPELVAQQLLDALHRLSCESVLLDFQRPWDEESDAMVRTIVSALPCPVAVTEAFAQDLTCPVFLAPWPLHKAPEEHLKPWRGREIWLEAALCQEHITVTKDGSVFTPIYPVHHLDGGFYDRNLRCRYHTEITDDRITFTLFDTTETLKEKLCLAAQLGVNRAVGLWQELGAFMK